MYTIWTSKIIVHWPSPRVDRAAVGPDPAVDRKRHPKSGGLSVHQTFSLLKIVEIPYIPYILVWWYTPILRHTSKLGGGIEAAFRFEQPNDTLNNSSALPPHQSWENSRTSAGQSTINIHKSPEIYHRHTINYPTYYGYLWMASSTPTLRCTAAGHLGHFHQGTQGQVMALSQHLWFSGITCWFFCQPKIISWDLGPKKRKRMKRQRKNRLEELGMNT